MGKSYATVTPDSFTIGPCQVTFNSIDIGGTKGGVKIKFKYEKANLEADQFGKTILDKAISGMMAQVTTNFLEVLDKDQLANVFPSLFLGGSSPHKYLDMKDQTAVRQLATAYPLELHPLVDDATDLDNEWYFWKANPNEDSEFDFMPDKQVEMKITWDIFLDTSVQPARVFRYGDHTL